MLVSWDDDYSQYMENNMFQTTNQVLRYYPPIYILSILVFFFLYYPYIIHHILSIYYPYIIHIFWSTYPFPFVRYMAALQLRSLHPSFSASKIASARCHWEDLSKAVMAAV